MAGVAESAGNGIMPSMEIARAAQRKIIHCDCDCFFAAVEMRDDAALVGLPVAVGGAERRGVVAACNYEAREFGIHSAMPMARAMRLCPNLVVVPPNFEKYREISLQIRKVFFDYTDHVEPLSLDEAFLDVTGSEQCGGSATLMAQEIKARIRKEVGITVSAGAAPNKFLAKIASDWEKPDGLFVITPEQVDDFVRVLPVGKIFGVGRATEKKLHGLGVTTCDDLRTIALPVLMERFGAMGKRLYDLCRGLDHREVKTDRRRKSLSVEHTYLDDLAELPDCLNELNSLHDKFVARLARVDSSYQVGRQFMKLRFSDFTTTTIERNFSEGPVLSSYKKLCEEAWERGQKPVRLIGLGVRFDDSPAHTESFQTELF